MLLADPVLQAAARAAGAAGNPRESRGAGVARRLLESIAVSDYSIGVIASLLVSVYLVYALLRPEKF